MRVVEDRSVDKIVLDVLRRLVEGDLSAIEVTSRRCFSDKSFSMTEKLAIFVPVSIPYTAVHTLNFSVHRFPQCMTNNKYNLSLCFTMSYRSVHGILLTPRRNGMPIPSERRRTFLKKAWG